MLGELPAALRRVFENHCSTSNTNSTSYNATTLAMSWLHAKCPAPGPAPPPCVKRCRYICSADAYVACGEWMGVKPKLHLK